MGHFWFDFGLIPDWFLIVLNIFSGVIFVYLILILQSRLLVLGQRQTETIKDKQKKTMTDKDRRKQRKTDRDKQGQVETDRDKQRQTETDRDNAETNRDR